MFCDVAIIGAGPAGLSAAIAAKKEGAQQVLLIERDESVGGILQQCIHPGFGLSYFQSELTGPEYAGRLADKAFEDGVEVLLNSMVLEILPEEKKILCINEKYGIVEVCAGSIILAMGCREKTRASLQIPGTRPSGIYTAGTAQRLVNRQNAMVGKRVVILGSGDIGMIMARRMSLEGAQVLAVVEIMDYLAGLTRNKVQCLDDFSIPLKLCHTVTRIVGNKRIEGVYIAQVDEHKKPMPETEEFIACDTLLLSVGLMPENELTRKAEISVSPVTNGPVVNQYMQTMADAVFACGNVLHVNDLVDHVTVESMRAGKYAAQYAMGKLPSGAAAYSAIPGCNVRYLCPQMLVPEKNNTVTLFFRVSMPQRGVTISAKSGGSVLASKKAILVNPGEMCSIELPTDGICGDVTVDVVKEA